MKVCPECSLELPDGIPTCPYCNLPMVDPDEEIEEFEPSAGEHRYVHIQSVPTRLFANMVREALHNEGIPSILQSEDVGIMLGNFGTAPLLPVRILVPACFRSRASRIARRIAGDL